MGKTVIANDILLNTLTTISKMEGFTLGLIIGQPSQKKDFVVHLSATPKLKGNESNTDEYVNEIEHIEENWLKVHVRNVCRSLPGGVYILGIFIVGPKDIFSDKLGLQKVRSLISTLLTTSKSNIYLYGNNQPTNKIVLHFCSKSKKYQSKAFDVNLSMSPVTWKFVKNPTSWFTINCNYKLSLLLPHLIFDNKSTSLRKTFKDALSTYKDKIDDCYCILIGLNSKTSINCETLEEIKNLIIKEMGSEGGGKRSNEDNENDSLKTFQAVMSMKVPETSESSEGIGRIEEIDVKGIMRFEGMLAGRTFLNASATVEEAVHAIKEDLIRSLTARLELHCDSLEDDSQREVRHEPPRRVLIKHPPSGIMFSDYMFPDDTDEDIVTTFQENLGIEVLPESIIEVENSPGSYQEICNQEIEEEKIDKLTQKNLFSRNDLLVGGLMGAFIVLIISLAAQFYYLAT